MCRMRDRMVLNERASRLPSFVQGRILENQENKPRFLQNKLNHARRSNIYAERTKFKNFNINMQTQRRCMRLNDKTIKIAVWERGKTSTEFGTVSGFLRRIRFKQFCTWFKRSKRSTSVRKVAGSIPSVVFLFLVFGMMQITEIMWIIGIMVCVTTFKYVLPSSAHHGKCINTFLNTPLFLQGSNSPVHEVYLLIHFYKQVEYQKIQLHTCRYTSRRCFSGFRYSST